MKSNKITHDKLVLNEKNYTNSKNVYICNNTKASIKKRIKCLFSNSLNYLKYNYDINIYLGKILDNMYLGVIYYKYIILNFKIEIFPISDYYQGIRFFISPFHLLNSIVIETITTQVTFHIIGLLKNYGLKIFSLYKEKKLRLISYKSKVELRMKTLSDIKKQIENTSLENMSMSDIITIAQYMELNLIDIKSIVNDEIALLYIKKIYTFPKFMMTFILYILEIYFANNSMINKFYLSRAIFELSKIDIEVINEDNYQPSRDVFLPLENRVISNRIKSLLFVLNKKVLNLHKLKRSTHFL